MARLILSTTPVPARAILLDTETTGLSPKSGERIVELAAIEYLDGAPSGREFHHYINPEHPVGYHAQQVHGLSNRFLADKPVFAKIAAEFLDFLGSETDPVFTHNVPFDRRFIDAELDRLGLGRSLNWRCSLQLVRQLRGKGSHKLETLAEEIGYKWTGRGAHSAIADCHALGAVLTQTLWPLEAKMAAEGPSRPAKTATPKAQRTVQAAKPTVPVYVLPEGFVPLTESDDGRIRRYDKGAFSDMITARGKPWSSDEENRLARAFLEDGQDMAGLVGEHGRTPGALLMRLASLGIISDDHPYQRR